jgi:preprotein translocase subunit SecA
MVTRAIAKAQKKVEDRNFEIRKSLLEYDEVMNQQRREIYGTRQEVLESKGLREKIELMFDRAIERSARHVYLLDKDGFKAWFHRVTGTELSDQQAVDATAKVGTTAGLRELVIAKYDEREKEITPELYRQVERYLLLKSIDDKWRDHLYAIDALKAGIGLRGYAQVDPKNEYKREGFQLFEKLLAAIEDEVTSLILRIQVQAPGSQPAPAPRYVSPVAPRTSQMGPGGPPTPQGSGGNTGPGTDPNTGGNPPGGTGPAGGGGGSTPTAPRSPATPPQQPPPRRAMPGPSAVPAMHAFDMARRQQAMAAAQQRAQEAQQSGGSASQPKAPQKIDLKNAGRNDPCPCGSGKKVKNCHGQ